MKVAAVVSTISGGGAARALVNVVNHWAGQGREVTLLTLDSSDQDFYEVHPAVERVGLDLISSSRWIGESVARNVTRLRELRRALREVGPDVVLAVEDKTAVRTLLATCGLWPSVAVWEQTDPRQFRLTKLWRVLRRALFPRAAVLAVQVERLRPWAEQFVSPEKVHVIPNPAVPLDAWDAGDRTQNGPTNGGRRSKSDTSPPDGGTALAVGRLVPAKGFDLLLEAFAACVRSRPDWRLVIVGEGTMRSKLERQAAHLGIEDHLELPGRVEDVASHYSNADLFVLSSRFEGFPNVLLEAMAAGLPVVSFDCPCGPAEIIRDGEDGVLVPAEDAAALASAMDRLMGNPDLRERLSRRAPAVLERYSVDSVAGRWERVLESVASEG